MAIHLPLCLNPVAAVRPQSGLGLSNYGGAWGETGQQLRYAEGSIKSRLATTVNVRVDLEQRVIGQPIQEHVSVWLEGNRKVKEKDLRDGSLVMSDGYIFIYKTALAFRCCIFTWD